MGARGEVLLVDEPGEPRTRGLACVDQLSQRGTGELRVAVEAGVPRESAPLHLPGPLDALADDGRALALRQPEEVLGPQRSHFDVQIEAVEDGTGDAAAIAFFGRNRADAAIRLWIRRVAARAGVHRPEQHEARRHGGAILGAHQGDLAIFEGLPERLERRVAVFRQFVHEEHAPMRERDLARPQRRPSADEARDGDGVVRRPEGPRREQTLPRIQAAGHGPDRRRLDRLLEGAGGKQPGQPAGQHGLSGAGRADEERVVTSGRGHLEGPLRRFLAPDFSEIELDGLRRRFGGLGGRVGASSAERRGSLGERPRPMDANPLHQRAFRRVLLGDDQTLEAAPARLERDGKHAAHRQHVPG